MNTNYRFGQFYLDTSSRNLFSEGKVTRLSPRAFEILVLLIKRRGEVVPKEEILSSIWPNSYVEENNLAVHISALRRVLKEKELNVKHIETVSGIGYRFLTAAREADARTPTLPDVKAEPAAPRSIAVMPFTAKTSDPKLGYIADGITDNLISSLSQLSRLKVISYTAVSRFRDDQSNIQEVGFLLGVDSVLVGSVIAIDEMLEIRLELVNVADLSQIWGTEYHRKIDQLYLTKRDISLAIAEKLQVRLSKSETKQISRPPVENTEAYNLYLRGRRLAELRSRESLLESIDCFEKALSLEPRFAAAMAYIGFAYTFLALSFYMPVSEAVTRAENAIRSALELDSELAEAYAIRGLLRLCQAKPNEANESFTHAISLNPNSGFAHAHYGLYLMSIGDFEAALKHHYISMGTNPVGFASLALSAKLTVMGQYQKAIENAIDTIEMFPENGMVHFILGSSYAHLGNFDAAINEIEKAIEIAPSTENFAMAGYINALAGNKMTARKVVDNLIDNYAASPVDFVDIAAIYSALGVIDEAFTYLEKAFESGFSHLFFLKIDLRFKALRNDGRFDRLVERLGFHSRPLFNA